jgi:hypothetical protein
MHESRIVQFILQFLFSTIGCLFFRAAGLLLLSLVGKKEVWNGRGFLDYFYPFFHGITFCIALYAVIQSHFLSIHILILGVYLVWLAAGVRGWSKFSLRPVIGSVFSRWVEVAAICLLFTAIFHFLPESEYKQDDSFFYLKIAESLNSTGQENLHLYNNVFDSSFHGVEPYHYAEMWLNALLLRGVGHFLPGIQVFRYIGYTILSVCVVYGLWGTYEVFSGRRAGWWARVFCIAFLFFRPDIMDYSALLRHYIGFAFDNNYLERSNFRTIYLCLIPFFLSLREGKMAFENVVYFICLSVVSYLCFLVLIPAMFIFALLGLIWPGMGVTRRSLMQKGLLAAATALCFGLFYGFFSNRVIGGFYQHSFQELLSYLRIHSFYVYSSFLTSLVYIAGVIFVCTVFFWIKKKDLAMLFWWENRGLIALSGVIIVTGVGIARILMYQENAYQLAFISYILAAFLIFVCWCHFSAVFQGRIFWSAGIGVFLLGYVLFKVRERRDDTVDVFRRGSSFYGSRHYTQQYIGAVTGYLEGRENLLGGYLEDSSYYRHMGYFSLRNPNVYFPPISYIIAGRVLSNYEFCLSDTAAILTNMDRGDAYEVNYLEDAIRRSGFYVYMKQTGLQRREALCNFIKSRHLQYLIVSGKASEAEVADIPTREKSEDPSTGEIFLVLKTPE